MSNFAFRQAALAYELILKFMREETSSTNPMTLRQVETQMNSKYPGQLKNYQQLLDATKKYHSEKKLMRIKPSGRENYWWAPPPGDLRQPSDETLTRITAEANQKMLDASKHMNSVSTGGRPKKVRDLSQDTQDIAVTDTPAADHKRPEITITKNTVLIVSPDIKITIEF